MTERDEREKRLNNFLNTIHRTRERELECQAAISMFVKAALEAGGTWRAIGEALGMSTQAAWKKYHPQKAQKINTSKEGDSIE